tara:strand:+ start:262 stop:1239 length:978 start_codon:yes stop_codon:yes gene_type:complete
MQIFEYTFSDLAFLSDFVEDNVSIEHTYNATDSIAVYESGWNPWYLVEHRHLYFPEGDVSFEEAVYFAVDFHMNLSTGTRLYFDEAITYGVRKDSLINYHAMGNLGFVENVAHTYRDATHVFSISDALYPGSSTAVLHENLEFLMRSANHFVFGPYIELNLTESVQFYHIRTNNIVYDIQRDAFSKFADFSVKSAYPVTKGFLQENIVLCLKGNEVKRYPGTDEPDYAQVQTKDYFIEHGVFQAYNVNFDTGSPTYNALGNITTVTKNADIDETKKYPRNISEFKSNKWAGFSPGAGYGYVGSLILTNIYKIKDLILKYKLRLEK